MLDARMRRVLRGPLDDAARRLVSWGVTATALTATGLVLGLSAAAAAGARWWTAALVLWLVSRLADGLDGPVARRTGRATVRGGYLDVVADFTVYGAFVVGCAVGQPNARLALLVLLATYYVNGTALLALSSAAARADRVTGAEDERSHLFTGGLAEGTETIVAHGLFVVVPGAMAGLAWVFAGAVAMTAAHRVRLAVGVLVD